MSREGGGAVARADWGQVELSGVERRGVLAVVCAGA